MAAGSRFEAGPHPVGISTARPSPALSSLPGPLCPSPLPGQPLGPPKQTQAPSRPRAAVPSAQRDAPLPVQGSHGGVPRPGVARANSATHSVSRTDMRGPGPKLHAGALPSARGEAAAPQTPGPAVSGWWQGTGAPGQSLWWPHARVRRQGQRRLGGSQAPPGSAGGGGWSWRVGLQPSSSPHGPGSCLAGDR